MPSNIGMNCRGHKKSRLFIHLQWHWFFVCVLWICKTMLTVGRLKVSDYLSDGCENVQIECKTKSDIFFMLFVSLSWCLLFPLFQFLKQNFRRDANLSKHQIMFWISFESNFERRKKIPTGNEWRRKKKRRKIYINDYPLSLNMMYKIT